MAGLEGGDADLLAAGLEDRLHVPYRLPLLPGAAQALGAAREAGAYGATLSGAGSGLVALAPRDKRDAVAQALEQELARATGGAESRTVEPVFGVPKWIPQEGA